MLSFSSHLPDDQVEISTHNQTLTLNFFSRKKYSSRPSYSTSFTVAHNKIAGPIYSLDSCGPITADHTKDLLGFDRGGAL